MQASVAGKEVLCSLDTAGDIIKVEVIVISEHVIGDIALIIFIKLSEALSARERDSRFRGGNGNFVVEHLQALGEQFSEWVR